MRFLEEDSPSLGHYLREIGHIPLFTREQEGRVSSLESRHDLLEANLRLVVFFAKRYRNNGLTFVDLIAAGNEGLLRAAEKFDARREAAFSSYASWWIRQHILRAIANESRLIRLPVHQHEKWRKISLAQHKFYAVNGVFPSVEEVAVLTELPEEDVELLFCVRDPISLDAQEASSNPADEYWFGSMRSSLVEGLPGETGEPNIPEWRVENAVRMLETLSPKEQAILRMICGLPHIHTREDFSECEEEHTLEDIGRDFSVTRERIRQIKEKALRKLRLRLRRDEAVA